MDKMTVMKAWLEEAAETMQEDDFNALCGQIIRYGLFESFDKTGNPIVDIPFSLITPQIDAMQAYREEKINQGKKGGRPCVLDNATIWKMAQTKSGTEIIKELNIKQSTLYSNEGWKQRKNASYLDNL